MYSICLNCLTIPICLKKIPYFTNKVRPKIKSRIQFYILNSTSNFGGVNVDLVI